MSRLFSGTGKIPGGLVVRISRSHRDGRGSIPRLGKSYFEKKSQGEISVTFRTHIIILCNDKTAS